MRNIVFASSILLAACSTMAPAEPEIPMRGETPGYTCSERGLEQFIGQPATPGVGAEILRVSGAKTLRWIPQGGAVTMDLRSDRVNARLDSQNRIESVGCG